MVNILYKNNKLIQSLLTLYLKILKTNINYAGYNLLQVLNNTCIHEYSEKMLLSALLETKKPCIFAESEIVGDKDYDWNRIELLILGNVSVSIKCTAYDNAIHDPNDINFKQFNAPQNVDLIYTVGALLQNPFGNKIDHYIVNSINEIDDDKFYLFYNEKFKEIFNYVDNEYPHSHITMPNIGGGCFSNGIDTVAHWHIFLKRFLSENIFSNIESVMYDSYNGNDIPMDFIINDTKLLIRPFNKCQIPQFHFKPNSQLVSLVAWDHVSYPGNDFYRMQRVTDDGVKSAATNSMTQFLGINGRYSKDKSMYIPIDSSVTWETYAKELKFQI